MKQTFEKIEINNREALFTNDRINRSQLPQGYYAYDIRHDDEGEPSTIEQNVVCNNYGTILTKVQIEMTEGDYTPICDINFLGEEVEV
ncbi:MAG: LPD28 domain-containing protein [Rikenellaceae bacterium]